MLKAYYLVINNTIIMGFVAGHKRIEGSGRAKGTKNKSPIGDIRRVLMANLVEYIVNPDENAVVSFRRDLEVLKPVDRINVMEKYMKYCVPTLSSINLEANSDEPMNISVTWVQNNPNGTDTEEDEGEQDYSIPTPKSITE